jgi:uronate dehydrogenase
MEAVCLRIGSVLEKDPPGKDPLHRATWLSHRDLCQLLTRALLAGEAFPGFGIYCGVSENTRRFWKLENAHRELGFHPEDDAEQFYRGG